MIQAVPRSLMGLSALALATSALAADPGISFQLTGAQAADYTVADSGWNSFSTVQSHTDTYSLIENHRQDAGTYVDAAGAVHQVSYIGNQWTEATLFTPYEARVRTLSLAALPSHTGPYEIGLEVSAEVGGTWSAAGLIDKDYVWGPTPPPMPGTPSWDAQFRGYIDPVLFSIVEPLERILFEGDNAWAAYPYGPFGFKPGDVAFALTLPTTASIDHFVLDFRIDETYGNGYWGTDFQTYFVPFSMEDRVITTAVPEPETWVLMGVCLGVLVGVKRPTGFHKLC
jgi:hypothetical protein